MITMRMTLAAAAAMALTFAYPATALAATLSDTTVDPGGTFSVSSSGDTITGIDSGSYIDCQQDANDPAADWQCTVADDAPAGDQTITISYSTGDPEQKTVTINDITPPSPEPDPMTVTPKSPRIDAGESVTFTIANYDPDTITVSTSDNGLSCEDPDADGKVVCTASDRMASGPVTVTFDDGVSSVTATVTVTATYDPKLSASPDALTFLDGGTVTITGSGYFPGDDVTLVLRDPDDVKIDSKAVTVGDDGTFSQDFNVDPMSKTGYWSVTGKDTVDGIEDAVANFTVTVPLAATDTAIPGTVHLSSSGFNGSGTATLVVTYPDGTTADPVDVDVIDGVLSYDYTTTLYSDLGSYKFTVTDWNGHYGSTRAAISAPDVDPSLNGPNTVLPGQSGVTIYGRDWVPLSLLIYTADGPGGLSLSQTLYTDSDGSWSFTLPASDNEGKWTITATQGSHLRVTTTVSVKTPDPEPTDPGQTEEPTPPPVYPTDPVVTPTPTPTHKPTTPDYGDGSDLTDTLTNPIATTSATSIDDDSTTDPSVEPTETPTSTETPIATYNPTASGLPTDSPSTPPTTGGSVDWMMIAVWVGAGIGILGIAGALGWMIYQRRSGE